MARKPDQQANSRSRHTMEQTKQLLLQMMQRHSFEKISVTMMCKEMSISRSTFYQHYYDTYDVLDDLIADILTSTAKTVDYGQVPGCQECGTALYTHLQSNPQYRPLLLDRVASRRFLEQITQNFQPSFTSYMLQHTHLTKEEADVLFLFQISGCLAANQLMLKTEKSNWRDIQHVIDQYIQGGLERQLPTR